jgi:hypothetical protein
VRRKNLNSDIINDILFLKNFEMCNNFVFYYRLKLTKYAEN